MVATAYSDDEPGCEFIAKPVDLYDKPNIQQVARAHGIVVEATPFGCIGHSRAP
jgi:hypothetical protein